MFRRGKLSFVSTKDDRIKIFNERINVTERHALEIATILSECARKTAKYRDTYDELARGIKNYADDEEICESLSEGMKNFTNAITLLGDYMDLNVQREMKVVNELAQLENICKNTRDSLRTAVVTRDKEVLKQRQMMEIKTKFSANNSAADSELVKSKLEVNRTNKEIDEILTNFEKRKLSEVKGALTDFILISMKYHTKALEVLSASYYDICNIDEKGDLMEFQKVMKTKEGQVHSGRKKGFKKSQRSQSMESLDRDQILSPLKRTNRLSRSTKNLSAKSEDELDADEEDDDDDAEEEDASEENSNENDSGSASEEALGEEDSDSQSEDKPNRKNTTQRFTHQPFRAQQNPTNKPFAARLRNSGIPTFPSSHKNLSSLKSEASGTRTASSGRLVTIVESKKMSREGD